VIVGRTVTLLDGREVDSASEEWRHEAEARAIAAGHPPRLAGRRRAQARQGGGRPPAGDDGPPVGRAEQAAGMTKKAQPMLFADLPTPSALPEAPPCQKRRRSAGKPRQKAQQLGLDFWAREFGGAHAGVPLDDEDTAWDFPRHSRIVAGHQPPPATSAAPSIWALAAAVRAEPRQRARPGKDDAAAPPMYRVEREAGRVRVVRLRPEETAEWAERERVRRAKQRPPKPTKQAKTRGKKVRVWDGEEVE
jgi:hypothetical protein